MKLTNNYVIVSGNLISLENGVFYGHCRLYIWEESHFIWKGDYEYEASKWFDCPLAAAKWAFRNSY